MQRYMRTVATRQADFRSDEQVQALRERWLAEVYAPDNSRSVWIFRANRRLLNAVVSLLKSLREQSEKRELELSSHPRWSA
jgi:hypothetical protein